MKTSIIKAVGGLLIVLFEIALFAYLDKSTYLHKGVSLGDYKTALPYYTKIQGDHNVSGFYYFHPIYSNGLELTPTLIFSNTTMLVPTVIYSGLSNQPDTINLSWIYEYGYNDKALVIKAITTDNTVIWLRPRWINKEIRITRINEESIDKSAYQWIIPTSGKALWIMISWLILLVVLPISLVYELYLIVSIWDKDM
jgi:hypothetical protein